MSRLHVSFEFFPPKTEKMQGTLWSTVEKLAPLGPDFVSVTYGAGGSTRARTHETVSRLVRETSLPVAAHLTCVAATRAEVDAVLKEYWAAGVKHIVALRGDPPGGAGDPYVVHPGGYANAAELAAGAKAIAPFEITVGCYPEKHPDSPTMAADIDHLKRKIDAGAMGESNGPKQQTRSTKTISSIDDLSKSAGQWKSAETVYLTMSFKPGSPATPRCTGIAFAFDEETTWFASLAGSDSELNDWQQQMLERVAGFSGEVITDNSKQLIHFLLRHGITRAPSCFDVGIVDYLLDAGERHHDLKSIVARRSDYDPFVDSSGNKPPARQKNLFDQQEDDGSLAADLDRSIHALQLVSVEMKELLEKDDLTHLYDDLERPLIDVLARMEVAGIQVDVDELNRQCAAATKKIDELTGQIYKEAGHEFNIDSPKQLSGVLFDELGLPVIKKTKTGASTDQEVLETLAPMHALPSMIVERRHLTKLRGTYLDALPRLVNERTGRIHSTFHQTVASTGRLSSSDPNLQNIPIRTPEGRQIRKAFVAGQEDWLLLCADYSQIELRVLAHFSQDEALLQAFHDNIDIHSAVAAEVFGVPLEEVTSDLRRVAKAVNFGIIYGQSPFGLAGALGIEKAEAAGFIDSYFGRYPGVATFCEQVLSTTQETGFARTIMNRRRAISGIRNTTGIQRNMPERTAINTVIQGSAADLIKQAMLNVDAALSQSDLNATMLMQIHDELVFETPADELDKLRELVVNEMTNAMQLDVPIVVDVTTGPNWLEQESS